MVAKAVGGVLFVGLVSTGGIAMTKPHWLGMDYMPEFHTLSKDDGYGTTYNEDQHFGKKYGKYLVGVTNEINGKDKNQSFWEWAFRQMSKEIKKSKFSTAGSDAKINKGFSDTDNDTALNQVCKAAYKTQESGFHNGTETNNGDKFNKGDVWKYCSPIGQEPTTVQKYDRKSSDSANKKYENGTEGGEKIGKKQETSLISVFDKGNDVFWNMRDKEIKEKTLNVDAGHNFFKKAEDKNTHIKDLCKEAYDKPSTSAGGTDASPSETETKKYCSLEATAS